MWISIILAHPHTGSPNHAIADAAARFDRREWLGNRLSLTRPTP